MYQACSVDHLNDLCQTPMLHSEFPGGNANQINNWTFSNAILSSNFQECVCLVEITHSNPTNPAVALDTRNTRAGLILFPPAPNIRWAADTKAGFSLPTICRVFPLVAWPKNFQTLN